MPTDSRTSVVRHLQRRARHRHVRHLARVLDQRLDAAERLGQREQLRRRAHPQRRLPTAGAARNDTIPPKPAHLLGRHLVAGVLGQARVEHPGHGGVPGEHLGDALGVVAVPLHPHRERLDAAQREPVVERPGHRADRVLGERQLLGELVVAGDERAADDVGVAAEVLGGGVQHDVRAQRERLLQVGRGEGVVDDEPAPRPRARDVRRPRRCPRCPAAGWSASRTRPPGWSAAAPRAARRGRRGPPACTRRPTARAPCRPAGTCRRRRRAGCTRWSPGRSSTRSRTSLAPMPEPNARRVPAALERGQALLQRGAGGVGAARVLVAARARAADAVLGEGGRQVQRA